MTNKTILIVDDTFENLYLLRVILEEAGFNIIEACDGSDGLEKLYENNNVDLIISDILMPVMDGYLFCQACKKENLFKKIPFVFYTSNYTEKLDEDFALKLGAAKFLRKPIEHDELLSTVKDILKTVRTKPKYSKRVRISQDEVLKLYSERLVNKLEQKSLDLGKEIKERKKAEQLLINKNEILDLIAVNTPLNKIFDRLLLNYESIHAGCIGSISLVNKNRTHLILESGPSLPKAYNASVKILEIVDNDGSCPTAAYTKKPVIVTDISTDKLWLKYKDLALKYNLKSCWSIPVLSKDNVVLGTFAIYSKSIKVPTLEEVQELNFAVSLANIAIERNRVVSEIKKKDESYKSLIDQASDSIVSYSLDGTIHDFNKAAYINLGYTEKEFSKLKVQDFNIGDLIQDPENLKKILNGEAVISARRFKCKDKSIIDVEISSKIREDGRIVAICRDVTERKKAEVKLQESEYNLRQSQIVGNIGSYNIDLVAMTWEGSIVLHNILGVSQSSKKTVKNWNDRVHVDEREVIQDHFEYCIESNIKFNKEYRVVKLNTKEEIWVHGIGELIFDSHGIPVRMIGTMQDITDRKHSEIKLLESEYSLRQSQVVANIGSYVVDLNTMTWQGSAVLDRVFGIDESYEKSIEGWGELIHPNEREEMLSYLRNGIANKIRFNKEYRVLKVDTKEEIWIHGVGELLFDKEANPIKLIGTMQDVTNRKKVEIELRESEYSLRQSQIVGNIGSYAIDLNTMTWQGSTVLNAVFGINKSYVKTMEGWVDRIHPDEREEIFNYFKYCVENNKKFNREYRILKFDTKEEVWVHGIGELLFNTESNPSKLIGTIQDITKRKRSEIKVHESEKSLLIAQKLAKIGSFDLNVKKLIGKTSTTFNEIIGVDNNTEINFDLWKTIVHPEDRSLLKEAVVKSQSSKQKFDLEYRIFTKDKKELKWIHGLGEIIYANGVAVSFIGTIQDITDRKKIALDLKISNDFSSSLLNGMNEGLYAINLDSEIISVNPSFCKMTGFTKKELIGLKRPFPFSPPELKVENDKRYKLLTQDKSKGDYENTYMRKNGDRFPVHVLVSSIYDESGERIVNFATVQDITERKKAEIDLKLAKEFNDKLVMSMQEGLLMLDTSGAIIKINDSLCEILGYAEEELIGLELPYPFAKVEDLSRMQEIEVKVSKGEAPSFKFEFTRKNGEQFVASFLSGSIKDDNGKILAIFATVKDVSEEEKAKKVLEDIAAKSKEKKDVILELANLVGENIDTTFNKITHLAAKTLNLERVSVWSYKKDKSELYCEKLYMLKNNKYEIGGVIKEIENPEYFHALESKQAVLVSNAEKNSITKRLAKEYLIPNNIKSLMDVVVNTTNGHYGIVCFEHVGDALRDWSSEDQAFSTSIASMVSLMIESTERKVAEIKTSIANQKLTEANRELNGLRNQLEQENMYLRNELDLVFNYEEMVYGSIEFSNVLSEVEKVAPTTATVLLLGESGTGKELLARAVHNTSLRNKKPLIKVNCSAIPRELIESELFGHKKGSFTGAINDKIGKFELADGGTLFLDEIGELPLDMQPKILRFLQEGEIEVVGGTSGLKKLDVRVIAATNRDLKAEVEKKQFREDLYFRLNVFPIEVPPLRKRKDDIPLLVEHFVDKFNKAYGKSIKYISDDAMIKLKAYNWPGNIRELENLIERASIVSISDTLLIPGFESSAQKSKSISKKDLSLDSVQRNHIIQILEQCNWKISGPKGAAIILDLKPSTLRDRMAKLEVTKA